MPVCIGRHAPVGDLTGLNERLLAVLGTAWDLPFEAASTLGSQAVMSARTLAWSWRASRCTQAIDDRRTSLRPSPSRRR
jgi:hypothetical protein